MHRVLSAGSISWAVPGRDVEMLLWATARRLWDQYTCNPLCWQEYCEVLQSKRAKPFSSVSSCMCAQSIHIMTLTMEIKWMQFQRVVPVVRMGKSAFVRITAWCGFLGGVRPPTQVILTHVLRKVSSDVELMTEQHSLAHVRRQFSRRQYYVLHMSRLSYELVTRAFIIPQEVSRGEKVKFRLQLWHTHNGVVTHREQ